MPGLRDIHSGQGNPYSWPDIWGLLSPGAERALAAGKEDGGRKGGRGERKEV